MPVSYQKMDNGYLFKINTTKDNDKIISIFNNILSQNNIKIVSSNFTSPQMTKVFIKDSIFACLFAFVCVGLYIIIRFNWKFALSAIITLMTDVLVVTSFISINQIEVCLVTLTAILTIIGYCINDKIIIFDRIKNNLDLRNTSIKEIVKNSVKSVLFRSLLTSVTTVVVATSLLFFDDRQIYELGITVIFGVIFGTISSIIIAPSILLALNIKHNRIVTEKDSMWYAS
jgi:preprotein translocase SecF subunit